MSTAAGNEDPEDVSLFYQKERMEENQVEEEEEEEDDDLFDWEERVHFEKVCNTFKSYKLHSYTRIAKTIKYLESLPKDHQQRLTKYRGHLDSIRQSVDANYEVMRLIVGNVCGMFENMDYSSYEDEEAYEKAVKPLTMDMEKTHSVLKQVVREWSLEGAAERETCFRPILDEVDLLFSQLPLHEKEAVSVLVPGAGLGRLAHEVARRGYTCQGNEYSLFMLFASNFVLNQCKGVHLHAIHPWLHQHHNQLRSSDHIKSVSFPDVDPSAIPDGTDFSMAAGNFLDIYRERDKWTCVATCYFIDTAHNVVSYIETIWNILKPGGFWINLGPLLYHFADIAHEDSIEPSYNLLKEIIASFGFVFLKERTGLKSYYTQNQDSMLSYEYKSVFFVCQKPV